MFRRLLLKVIVFFIIVGYFSYYEYNDSTAITNDIHLSTLLLYEQQLFKQLNIEVQENITPNLIDEHQIAYVEGNLLQLSSFSNHIIEAKIRVHNSHNLNIDKKQVITFFYTNYPETITLPTINESYIWLIQESKEDYYFLQGGHKGILPLSN